MPPKSAPHCWRRRIPFEIVPGVTMALAAAAYAGVPVTGRQLRRPWRWSLVTKRTTRMRRSITRRWPDFPARWSSTWALRRSIIGPRITAAGRIARRDARGRGAPLHLARSDDVSYDAWRWRQRCRERKLRPPVITIVGDVAAAEPLAQWFTNRPLFGQRIVVTRPQSQPMICATASPSWGRMFCCSRPSRSVRSPIRDRSTPYSTGSANSSGWSFPAPMAFARCSIGCSSATMCAAWRACGWPRLARPRPTSCADIRCAPSLCPRNFGPKVAAALGQRAGRAGAAGPGEPRAGIAGRRACVRPARLVEQVVVYESRDVVQPDPAVAEALAAGRVTWVTVTSSAIARSLRPCSAPICTAGPSGQHQPRDQPNPPASGLRRRCGSRGSITTAGLIAAILAGGPCQS